LRCPADARLRDFVADEMGGLLPGTECAQTQELRQQRQSAGIPALFWGGRHRRVYRWGARIFFLCHFCRAISPPSSNVRQYGSSKVK
jgi:hypothetical protein